MAREDIPDITWNNFDYSNQVRTAFQYVKKDVFESSCSQDVELNKSLGELEKLLSKLSMY